MKKLFLIILLLMSIDYFDVLAYTPNEYDGYEGAENLIENCIGFIGSINDTMSSIMEVAIKGFDSFSNLDNWFYNSWGGNFTNGSSSGGGGGGGRSE